MPGEEIKKLSTSSIDKKILKTAMGGQRSGKALSEAVNALLSPEEAAYRLREMLDEDDVLSAQQDKRLLIMETRDLYQRISTAWDDGDAKPADVINALKLIADRLDKAELNANEVMNRLSRDQADLFIGALTAVSTKAMELLAARGKDIPELQAVMVEAVRPGFKQIEASVDG